MFNRHFCKNCDQLSCQIQQIAFSWRESGKSSVQEKVKNIKEKHTSITVLCSASLDGNTAILIKE